MSTRIVLAGLLLASALTALAPEASAHFCVGSASSCGWCGSPPGHVHICTLEAPSREPAPAHWCLGSEQNCGSCNVQDRHFCLP